MAEWLYLAAYVAGFLITCRLLARYAFDTSEDGLLIVGLAGVFWPLLAIVVAVVALFAFLVCMATLGVNRRG